MTLFEIMRERFAIKGDGRPYVLPKAGNVNLLEMFGNLGFRFGAEIGVWKGEFSRRMYEFIPGLHLIGVDPWQAYETYADNKNNQARLDEAYQAAVLQWEGRRGSIFKMTSLEAAAQVADGSLDFVYIDANHQEQFVTDDLNAWLPKIRSGGVMSGHDYITRAKQPDLQVKPAVDRFTREHAIDPWFVLAGNKTPSFAWVVA